MLHRIYVHIVYSCKIGFFIEGRNPNS
jgi:hypothetical protein